MQLGIKDRLVLNMVLEPQSGRADVLRLIRKLREDLSFSEDEIKQIGLQAVEEGKGFKWNPAATLEKEIPIGDAVMNIIKKQFQKMDKEERLMEDHLDIYAKFVPEEKPEEKK